MLLHISGWLTQCLAVWCCVMLRQKLPAVHLFRFMRSCRLPKRSLAASKQIKHVFVLFVSLFLPFFIFFFILDLFYPSLFDQVYIPILSFCGQSTLSCILGVNDTIKVSICTGLFHIVQWAPPHYLYTCCSSAPTWPVSFIHTCSKEFHLCVRRCTCTDLPLQWTHLTESTSW